MKRGREGKTRERVVVLEECRSEDRERIKETKKSERVAKEGNAKVMREGEGRVKTA